MGEFPKPSFISLILWISGRIAISNGLWSPGAGIMRINEGAKFLIETHRYQKILIYVREKTQGNNNKCLFMTLFFKKLKLHLATTNPSLDARIKGTILQLIDS